MSKKQKGTVSTRMFVTLVAVMLVLGGAVGGTLAWLTAQTAPVVNTFTVGDVGIELKEHKYDPDTNTLETNMVVTENTYKILPGTDLPKDPYVTVNSDSEACWLFLKVEEENFIDGLSYSLFDFWTKVSGETNVYYVKSPNTSQYPAETYPDGGPVTKGYTFAILNSNKIIVSGDITQEQLEALDGKTPQLKFTAYAIQYEGITSAADAWAKLKSAEAAGGDE